MTLDSSCEWKPIDVFPTTYLISNDGRVFSVRNEIELRPSTDRDGYLYYVMCVDGMRLTAKAHRLVAEAFIPNPDGKPTVDHINGDRRDNRVENLRWATHEEQWANPHSIERHKAGAKVAADKLRGTPSKQRKPVYVSNGEFTVLFPCLKTACEFFGVSQGKASECANGKRKSVKGYQFAYSDKHAVAVAKYHFPESE